jgi:hypothetical protein
MLRYEGVENSGGGGDCASLDEGVGGGLLLLDVRDELRE